MECTNLRSLVEGLIKVKKLKEFVRRLNKEPFESKGMKPMSTKAIHISEVIHIILRGDSVKPSRCANIGQLRTRKSELNSNGLSF